MSPPIRMTSTTRAVLEVLLAAARQDVATYGLEVCKATGLGSGTVYPILTRLERIGWVRARWEESDAELRGPRRRLYELTGEGRAQAALAERPALSSRLGWSGHAR
ncbi:PadR family transcriptional regulator [Microbispora bryophytorum]|uniref:Helix-turn-helix transcriptional regulator n=1 Tax=Microbispora bryophytorum subsp. camponoti TaxID=1677852 RepID=A0ABR8L131_9ACTN|nr:helix-turn-helix transcriptional regulator [Microbispora camponoti]